MTAQRFCEMAHSREGNPASWSITSLAWRDGLACTQGPGAQNTRRPIRTYPAGAPVSLAMPSLSRPTWMSPRVFRTEVLAGLVVAIAVIPEAISFSILAGVDPRVGLFASFTMAVTIAFSAASCRCCPPSPGSRG